MNVEATELLKKLRQKDEMQNGHVIVGNGLLFGTKSGLLANLFYFNLTLRAGELVELAEALDEDLEVKYYPGDSPAAEIKMNVLVDRYQLVIANEGKTFMEIAASGPFVGKPIMKEFA